MSTEITINTEDAPNEEVELAPVVHSYWKYKGYDIFKGFVYCCPLCKREVFTKYDYQLRKEFPYCHCGAKMDLKEHHKEKTDE